MSLKLSSLSIGLFKIYGKPLVAVSDKRSLKVSFKAVIYIYSSFRATLKRLKRKVIITKVTAVNGRLGL